MESETPTVQYVIEKINYFSKESGFYELKPDIWKMELFILQITH